jgi:predicted nucleic acid-binding protein
MRRFLVDTMILDRIVGTEGAARLFVELHGRGEVQLVVTHIQEDELAAIRDANKRRLIAMIPRQVVATYGFVIGTSRIGMSRMGEDEPVEAIRAPNWPKFTNDALIAATAQYENVTLVTDERRLLNRARRELGIEVWNWATFHQYLVEAAARTAV